MAVVDEGVDRHQLDGGDAELVQMLEHGRVGQRRVGAALLLGDLRVQLREALDVQFIDQRIAPRRRRRPVVAPVEVVLDDLRLGHQDGVVAPVERQIGVFCADLVAEVGVVPAQAICRASRVGVEQQLVRVEAVTLFRPVRTVHAVAVEQTGAFARQIAVPDEIGLLRHGDALDFAPPVCVEQAQLNFRRVFREEREIHALSVPRRTQGARLARPHRARGFDHRFVHHDAPIA